MLFIFIRHQWLSFWRSKGKGRDLGIQLVMGFLILYIMATALLVGFNLDKLIIEFFPDKSVFAVFNGLLLYYFALDFLMRFQLQELPALAIVPYLHLRIPKEKILDFLQLRPLFSVFNLIPFFIFTPFILSEILLISDTFTAAMYLFALLCLVLWNNYTVLYLKRIATGHLWLMISGFFLAGVAALLEYLGIYHLSGISDFIFSSILSSPWIAFLFMLPVLLIFRINGNYLRHHLYTEEITGKRKSVNLFSLNFPASFGLPGKLASLEIKLILRNKRPRATVSKSLIFIFYGFVFYKQKELDANQFGLLFFAAIFMVGNISTIYGQFMFGWQGEEFDGLMTSKMTLKDFFRGKLLLMTTWTVLFTLILSPYGFLNPKILLLHFTACLYYIGIGNVVVLYFATFNSKKIELGKGASMNWQGVSASTIILALPLIMMPVGLYYLFSWISTPYVALYILAGLGFVALLLQGHVINILTRAFKYRKYKITEGFRQNS
ncbi:DUF5687 family protein [Pedobacter antarcticus]|uniref:DUF5687 family protein n=1 Tax=Pedobacter antarcticus TaxID=34086 RepID=UPI000880CFC7|nr:DUF5687 family protein [Pedobacter antarcticus]SDL95021.1 hypothetical protein SAMN04488084_10343 [Pedobacter antarcticus]